MFGLGKKEENKEENKAQVVKNVENKSNPKEVKEENKKVSSNNIINNREVRNSNFVPNPFPWNFLLTAIRAIKVTGSW